MRSVLLGTLLIFATFAGKVGDRAPEVRYDPATVVDLTGVVEDIREVATPGALRGIHIILKTEDGPEWDVYVGPSAFVKEFVSNFRKKAQIQVTGARVKGTNPALMLAREVRRGSVTLYLRDKEGRPFWGDED
jgi:hypothetical protein